MRKYFSVCFILLVFLLCGCAEKSVNDISQLKKTGSMNLEYATQFTVDYLENDTALVSITDGQQYLIIPQNAEFPNVSDKNVTVIRKNPENVYLSASSSMDFFSALNLLDFVEMTSTKAVDWSIPEIREMVENDDIAYVGKYSAPDYEYLITENCGISIQSTMIYHNPEVKEKLNALGIPVLIERSSYESHPLGRMEWIKLYGLLYGIEDEAEDFFNSKRSAVENLKASSSVKPTVAFFSISSNGYATVRKPNDYISEMIRISGGEYIFTADDLNTDENALSTMNMQIETFYEKAKNADILIYNSAIDGGVESISQLVEKADILSDFKAVKSGNVWCTEKNMFQKTTSVSEMILDMNEVINCTQKNELSFLRRLE
ncbi:MAG: ABC transporter substrate-binding protein [Ruminococcus sp.]|nr:ABC transporter substrate-binding protein [Ruminococcus sp.]